MARLRHATATSAGGVVVRNVDGVSQIVAGHRHREHDSGTWTLPKGTPDASEALDETALREVAEETGLTVRIVEPLDTISYTFIQDGARVHKTVHYWLMEPTGGDLARHDHEFDEVRWVALADAPALLTFETERGLVQRAAAVLAAGQGGPR